MVPVRIRPVPLTCASVRGGFLSLFPAAYGVRSPADAPALTSQGSDFLSPFPRPAKAGHMVGVAQRQSGGLQNRMSRVRIPPRPPRRIRCAGCQKWESPNLSSADSRQRPPAGVEPYPAVIWDSSSEIESLYRRTQRSPVRFRPVPPTPKPCVVHGSGLMPCPDGSIRLTNTSLLSE